LGYLAEKVGAFREAFRKNQQTLNSEAPRFEADLTLQASLFGLSAEHLTHSVWFSEPEMIREFAISVLLVARLRHHTVHLLTDRIWSIH
jgi:hypothetical protein